MCVTKCRSVIGRLGGSTPPPRGPGPVADLSWAERTHVSESRRARRSQPLRFNAHPDHSSCRHASRAAPRRASGARAPPEHRPSCAERRPEAAHVVAEQGARVARERRRVRRLRSRITNEQTSSWTTRRRRSRKHQSRQQWHWHGATTASSSVSKHAEQKHSHCCWQGSRR